MFVILISKYHTQNFFFHSSEHRINKNTTVDFKLPGICDILNEPPHENTNNSHRQKQSCRSAVQ